MACYLGNPDINFQQIAKGFGIDGAVLEKPGDIGKVMKRAIAATREAADRCRLRVRSGRSAL